MYFDDCTNLEELKKLYKKLCFKNHPDLGGNEETMKAINNEYDIYLQKLAFIHNADESNDGKPYDWKNDKFADILQKIIHFANMEVEIIGTWIWCFNCFEYHEQLKELGFWFSKSKKAWVYSGTAKARYRSRNTVDDLRTKWGSEKVQTERQGTLV